jgi:hypothetical protein
MTFVAHEMKSYNATYELYVDVINWHFGFNETQP